MKNSSIRKFNYKQEPPVSVCIPAYNKGNFIAETIDSVLNQTYRNYEIIIVDNASTDNTQQIVESNYKDKVFFYRSSENVGANNNFNKCLSLSNYAYCLLLPADDLILPTFLETTVGLLEKYPKAAFAATNRFYIDENSNILGLDLPFVNNTQIVSGEFAIRRILEMDGKGVTMPLFRKKLLEDIGGFRPDIFFSDVFAWIQICAYSDIVYLNEPLLTWRSGNNDNITANLAKNHVYLDQKIYTLNEIFKFLEKNNLFDYNKKECLNHLLKSNTSKVSSLKFPPAKKKLLSYLIMYARNNALNSFSFRELIQIIIIFLLPKNLSILLYKIANRIYQKYSRTID